MTQSSSLRGASRLAGVTPRAPAYTLLEILVVVTLISSLAALLLPALNSVREQAKGLQCASNLRSVGLEFEFFAEGMNAQGRGGSEVLGRGRFWISDFQESLYHIDEFWDLDERAAATLESGKELMVCPAGGRPLTKRRGYPCGSAAIGPVEDVTLAANMRLHRATIDFMGKLVLAPAAATHVRSSVLSHPYVPLIMDVDGREAAARGVEPFYAAPPIEGRDDPYASGRYWTPSGRHRGKNNVVFVGGHVLTSAHPEEETWDWEYQGSVGSQSSSKRP